MNDLESNSILICGKPIGMSSAISSTNVRIQEMNFDEAVEYVERLELVSEVQH